MAGTDSTITVHGFFFGVMGDGRHGFINTGSYSTYRSSHRTSPLSGLDEKDLAAACVVARASTGSTTLLNVFLMPRLHQEEKHLGHCNVDNLHRPGVHNTSACIHHGRQLGAKLSSFVVRTSMDVVKVYTPLSGQLRSSKRHVKIDRSWGA
jgi:hypothetical protein